MRRPLLIVPILLLLVSVPQAAEEETATSQNLLRILDITETDLPRETLYAEFHVLDDLGGILVAQPSATDQNVAAKLNIPSQLVSAPTGTEIHVVSLRGQTPERLAETANVLHVCEDIALAAVAPGMAASLERPTSHYGLEKGSRPLNLDRIKPMKPFKAPPHWNLGVRAADPRIEAMVAQVSATNLEDTVQDLQDTRPEILRIARVDENPQLAVEQRFPGPVQPAAENGETARHRFEQRVHDLVADLARQ